MRYARGFGAFWYDFLIGDRPELFVGSIVVMAMVAVAIQIGLNTILAGGVFTILVLVLAGLSVWSATRRQA
jgi:hypothetical protein